MRIVIDMQGAQAESRFRGIGCYTLSLAQSIVRNRGENEVILALSGLFPYTIEPIRAAFDGLLSQENIRVWYAPGPVRECEPGNEWRREVAERIREAFLASLRPDVVFIPIFFVGYQDDGVTSIALIIPNLTTVVVVDRLDIAQPDVANPDENIYALRKLEHLKRADLLLALSPLTVDEVCRRLKVPHERVKAVLTLGEAETDRQDATAEARDLLKIFKELTTASPQALHLPLTRRSKLAYVSPLPPERSGISDYGAELLPELARFYDIDVIVAQAEMSTPWITANCGVRTVEWFLQNSHRYSRVLYHFGNSRYHQHMFDLLACVPGVVVLHDFYLGHVHSSCEANVLLSYAWTRELYASHGYGAVAERFSANNGDNVVWKYPVNLSVLQQARGVIVHSEYSRHLASEWYRKDFTDDWRVIPHLRSSSVGLGREQSRAALGLKADDFVVCSFGLLGPIKLNHRLLETWLHSRLAQDARCILVFVGEDHGSKYGVQLRQTIHANGLAKRIRITGWADMPTFRNYLASADIAVQLRTLSRGETSGTVLDCMNHALPTIVNANGSMADFPSDAVWMLPDIFEDSHLVEALETLWQDGERRAVLGKRAQEVILTHHAPRACAEQYAEAIEQFHVTAQNSTQTLVKAIAELEGHHPTDAECLALAQSISHALPITKAKRQLLVDVSATCREDLKTGIQRVVRALVWELVQAPPPGYRVEPVCLMNERGRWQYRYAREWTSNTLGFSGGWIPDEPAEYSAGDLMLIADFTGMLAVEGDRAGLFEQLRLDGIGLHFVVYDLLPIQMPEVFPPGQFGYMEWLNVVSRVADSAICISRAVADELRLWVEGSCSQRLRPINIGWFHLGANIENTIPTDGLPEDAEQRLSIFSAVPSFLLVGTIEPRKGYLQTLEAFTQLWQEGLDVNLIIVGQEGWKHLPNDMRRTIPEIVNRLRNHPELGKRLFWMEGVSDEYLEKIYKASTCLIAASEGEGFGLPLIEAAQHELPLIARDIPVFREVTGEHAYYFSGASPENLANAIRSWLALNAQDKVPSADGMPWLTWAESAKQLIDVLLEGNDNGEDIHVSELRLSLI